MDLAEIGWGGVDLIVLAQYEDKWGALANTVMNLWVLYSARKPSSGFIAGGFSSSAQLNIVS
jgi:hypothetical protein